MVRIPRNWLPRGLFLAALLAPGGAFAKPDELKQQCVDAYDQTQALRSAGKLRLARDSAVICAQAACPSVVTKDCVPWLEALEKSLPTVVFSARDRAGQETTAVRVLMDGVLLAPRLDGLAVTIDPGEHVFRFELDGQPPSETRTLIREGEKNRHLDVSFVPPPPPPATFTLPPTSVLVLGGVGALALGSFVTFALLGQGQKASLEKSCAPRCTDAEVSSVRTKLTIGDVSLVTGLLALGAGTTLFLLDRQAPTAAAAPAAAALRFDYRPRPGGGAAVLNGTF